MVTGQAKAMNASETVDLISSSGSSNIPVPFPFLFYWKTVTVSGNAVK